MEEKAIKEIPALTDDGRMSELPENYVISDELRELVQSQPDGPIDGPTKSTEEKAEPKNDLLVIQERRFRCPECHRYTAETEEKMIRHIRKVHRGENPFNCYMCEYSTYNKSLFEEHVRIHQGIKPFKCSQCPYRSASKKNTKKHELIHRPNNPLRCTVCNIIARNKKSLICHYLTHLEKNCTMCSFITKDVNEFKRHMKTHIECYVCKDCDYITSDFKDYRVHQKSRRRCTKCTYVACSRGELSKHMIVHGVSKKKIIDKKEMFTCSLCAWSGSTKARILLHLIHHPNQKVDEDVVDISILKKYGIMT